MLASEGFGKWMREKMLLSHVVMHTNPWIYLLKCALVIALVLVFDQRVTKQPDSVTSLFTALLCLGPTVLLGSKAGLDIFIASMIGAAWGTLCTVIFHVHGDNVLHFDSYFLLTKTSVNGVLQCQTAAPHCSTYLWLLLARIPLGVCLTVYTLLVIRRADPGLFSALYVQLLSQAWPYALKHPDTDFWLEKNVIATIIVRIIATLTGVLAATAINGVISGFFMRDIFKKRLQYIERDIRKTVDLIDTQHPASQFLFSSLFELLGDLSLAMDEAKLRHTLFIDRIIGDERPFLVAMRTKVSAIFHLLSVQTFLALTATLQILGPDEQEAMKRLLRGSKKKHEVGFAERALIENMAIDELNARHRDGINFIRQITLHFMNQLGQHDNWEPSGINPI